ncbi:MAG: 23S rRNA (uracil(1939)-C(5))-methyltransferase RlmD [Ignavibacteriae bacterium]|nr:23S rRNA (uracil(1939)-C(5))-methyltransferase RlmD [Ignavibacteriota bacterium]
MSRRNQRKKRINEFVELTIESLGFEGVAIARHEGIVHFVKQAVPGDVIIAEVFTKKSSYAEARIKEIITPSPIRVTPVCIHFGVCGGCSWQNLPMNEQLLWKKQHVADSFERIGKVSIGELTETLSSPRTLHYRNKMEFSFGASRWLTDVEMNMDETESHKNFALGLHIPGRFDKVLDVENCYIAHEISGRMLTEIRKAALKFGASAYNARQHHGFLRNVIIRSSAATGEIMVIILTSPPTESGDEQMIDWLDNIFPELFPELTTVIHAVNRTTSPVAVGEPRIIKGSGFITEIVLGVEFRISPFSFFQTNPWQLERFLSDIIAAAQLSSEETLWDLYCGTGSITLPAAKLVKNTFGVELSCGSIEDARENAERNGISNVQFFVEDLHKPAALEILQRLSAPDVIIIDPPRAGVHTTLLAHILEVAPPRLVYVSCNPATQARDCAILAEKYDVVKVQPVDMFPHTYHVESIAQLIRR